MNCWPYWEIGDGHCNPHLNHFFCEFDHGDCCKEDKSCHDHDADLCTCFDGKETYLIFPN